MLANEGVIDVLNRLIVHDDNSFFRLIHYFLESVLYDVMRFEFTALYISKLSNETSKQEEVDDE